MCLGTRVLSCDTKTVEDQVAVDPLVTDLSRFRPDPANFAEVPVGNFAQAHRIATGINGDLIKYVTSDSSVVVKKIKGSAVKSVARTETDERKAHLRSSRLGQPPMEDPLAEIGVMNYLAAQSDVSRYLLRGLGVFAENAPMGPTWLVMEYADGGELFEVVKSGGALPTSQVQQYMRQLLEAVAYLHKHSIAHRDISLENVLLKDGEVRLMDFGMAVQSHSEDGTPLRYFRPVGKDFYRGPECYVAGSQYVDVTTPKDLPGPNFHIVQTPVRGVYLSQVKLPKTAVAGRPCRAEVFGYESQPADMFAVGMCAFIMLTGVPLFQRAVLNDPVFAYFTSRGLEGLLKEWKMQLPCPDAMALLDSLLQANPDKRANALECIEFSLFHDVPMDGVRVTAMGGA